MWAKSFTKCRRRFNCSSNRSSNIPPRCIPSNQVITEKLFETRRVAIIRSIAMRAACRMLLSQQYELWVKCGPAACGPEQWSEKWRAAVLLFVGGRGFPSNSVDSAEAYLRTKWYPDPSSHLAIIGKSRKVGGIFSLTKKILGRPQPPNDKCYS